MAAQAVSPDAVPQPEAKEAPKKPDEQCACIMPFFRSLWSTLHRMEQARVPAFTDKIALSPDTYQHVEFTHDLGVLRQFAELEYDEETHTLALSVTFKGDFVACHKGATISIYAFSGQYAMIVCENGVENVDSLHVYVKAEHETDESAAERSHHANITTGKKAATRILALMRKCQRTYHDLMIASSALLPSVVAFERLIAKHGGGTELSWPSGSVCMSTQSRMMRARMGEGVTQLLETALAIDMDRMDAGAIARRNGVASTLLTAMSNEMKLRQ